MPLYDSMNEETYRISAMVEQKRIVNQMDE